jgi:hypothetical protein
MSYETNYDLITDELKRREQALKDLKSWLGTARFKKVSQAALVEKERGARREDMEASVSLFLGISGYPVTVWLDHLGYPPRTPKTPPNRRKRKHKAQKWAKLGTVLTLGNALQGGGSIHPLSSTPKVAAKHPAARCNRVSV